MPETSRPYASIFRFDGSYFAATLSLFALEVFIAKFVADSFIRPFAGDAIAVVLLYGFFRTFLRVDGRIVAAGCFVFACLLETAQGFHLADRFGLSGIARIVLGSTFDPMDLVAYAAGAGVCLLENHWRKEKRPVLR